jgi:hypothetical protein
MRRCQALQETSSLMPVPCSDEHQKLLASDPLLASIVRKVNTEGRPSSQLLAVDSTESLAPEPRKGSNLVDATMWEIPFQELQLQRAVGEGSFGRVGCGGGAGRKEVPQNPMPTARAWVGQGIPA